VREFLSVLLRRVEEKQTDPPDQASWSVYGKLYEDNLLFLRGIWNKWRQTGQPRDAVRAADWRFLCCLHDEAAVEETGIAPFGLSGRRRSLKTVKEIAALAAQLQMVSDVPAV